MWAQPQAQAFRLRPRLVPALVRGTTRVERDNGLAPKDWFFYGFTQQDQSNFIEVFCQRGKKEKNFPRFGEKNFPRTDQEIIKRKVWRRCQWHQWIWDLIFLRDGWGLSFVHYKRTILEPLLWIFQLAENREWQESNPCCWLRSSNAVSVPCCHPRQEIVSW